MIHFEQIQLHEVLRQVPYENSIAYVFRVRIEEVFEYEAVEGQVFEKSRKCGRKMQNEQRYNNTYK